MDDLRGSASIKRRAVIGLLVAMQALAGCQSAPFRDLRLEMQGVFGSTRGEPALASGIRQYEEGNYAAAAESLNKALFEGLTADDRVNAHKYLAFIHCVSNRPSACLVEFRRALHIRPDLELSAAEAGHPIWGPVFRALRNGR